MAQENPVLVEVCRGGRVESVHRGAVVVADGDGKVVWSAGDETQVSYPRSSLKMFQALPVVLSGVTESLRLSGEDYALLLASHSGELPHTRRVAALLQKIDLTMDALECGSHNPYDHATSFNLEKRGEAPCPLHNNCSGKHSGMLMLAHAKKTDHKNYIDPAHAVQIEIAKTIEKFCDVKLSLPAIDGCSAPTFALPMVAMARGLARFGAHAGDDQAGADLLLQAAMAHPYFVAGTGRHCTMVMETLPGKVFVKTGAEAFYAAVIPHLGLGVAIKIDDGAERASQLALNGVLHKLGLVDDKAKERITLSKELKSFRGLAAGEMRVAQNIFS
ncbi:MAG: asparaginase [Hydrotalea sp.]|nr:asparaginase [Hydrotalea sp.]